MKNLGLSYYKEYFMNLEFTRNENGKFVPSLKKDETKTFIKNFFDSRLDNDTIHIIDNAEDCFELTTIYPGLLIGSGYNHEIGKQENELKLGFFFDYTTGLPCIPGSSVKGVLRDACEKVKGDYILSILKELADGTRQSSIKHEVTDFWENGTSQKIITKQNGQKYSEFVMKVFEGKQDKDNYLPLKERDIFFDAFPIKSDNEGKKFLANDYITNHANPLKNPNPIQLLKVLPRVTFQFNFSLSDICMPVKIKKELFKQILLDLGIGAKTNVGYGHFKE